MLTHNIKAFQKRSSDHAAADLYIGGTYLKKATGQACFIGCHIQSNDPQKIEDMYGIPVALIKIAESIFENIDTTKAKTEFALEFAAAVGHDGRDLSRVQWQFLSAMLREILPQPNAIQAVIDPVIAGINLLASGQKWIAAYAADAAYADAADAAAYAADVSHDRQRIMLIEILIAS